jgi:sulfur carrier protein ThiS adenylyltransferase
MSMVPVDFSRARVGIIGLGGLGSNIAIMLARAGISNLKLADFDDVELDNLNRQHYFPVHVGLAKTAALAGQLHALRPSINLELWNQKIQTTHLEKFCEDCDIIIEAVDEIAAKASILRWFEEHPHAPWIVAASGVAGLGLARAILTIMLA